MNCKFHKDRASTMTDETGGAWCQDCEPRYLVANYGKAHNFPQISYQNISIWGGAGAWKVTIPRMSLLNCKILLEHFDSERSQSLSEPQNEALNDQKVSIHLSAQKTPLSASEPCFLFMLGKCNREATREDKHGRFWCSNHAPQGAYLAPWLNSFLESEPFDLNTDEKLKQVYQACGWFDRNAKEHPASQAISYALGREYQYLSLNWYTPEIKRLFVEAPEQAIAWAEALREAKKTNQRDQALQLAAQVNAHMTPVDVPENLERCFCCTQETELFDEHGRPYCLLHAPSVILPLAIHDLPVSSIDKEVEKPEPSEAASDAATIDEVELCSTDAAHGAALYYSPLDGEPLCERCWQGFLAQTG